MSTELTETPIAEYQPTAAALADLQTRFKDVVYAVTMTKGMTQAKEARRELRDLRVKLEATRKEIKEPALRRCQQIDSEARRISGELEALEGPIDAQIKAEERRKEDERLAREEAERQRVANIHACIAAFGDAAAQVVGKPSSVIRDAIERLREAELSPDVFQEFGEQAAAAKTQALEAMEGALERQIEHEAEQERIRRDREELDRLRREADERAERERVEREEREEREREERAEQLRQEHAEYERRQANYDIVQAIRDIALEFVGAPSSTIDAEINRLGTDEGLLAGLDADFREAGEQALVDTVAKLRNLLETAQRREAEAEELRQQRERQEQERKAEEARQQQERQRLADERARLEAEALANVTLHDAAQSALDWFNDNGYGQEQPARMLDAVLSRESAEAEAA